MILAMTEGRHLKNSWISVAFGHELLRKDRMGHVSVEGRRSAVSYNESAVTGCLKHVLEVRANCLHRERIDRLVVAPCADILDPDPPKDLGIVILQEIHQFIQKADGLASIATGSPSS